MSIPSSTAAARRRAPRLDILIFLGVLVALVVALFVVLNGRPGMGRVRLVRAEPT